MKFDDIFKEIGEFGPYQRRNYAFLIVGWMLTAPIMALSVFILGLPDHRCKIPVLDNDTYEIQGAEHSDLIHEYIPLNKDGKYDQCNIYKIHQSTMGFDNNSRPINASKTKCSAWVYSRDLFHDTFVTKVNLVCDDKYKISLAKTIFFAGVLTGSFVFGIMSDVLGRRQTILVSILLELASNLALPWSYNFTMYVILRFCGGAAAVGLFMTSFVLGMEWVGPSTRRLATLVIAFFGPVGVLYLTLVSYLARDWFWIVIAATVPFAIDAMLWLFIPESPRWLFSMGRKQDAIRALEKAASYNQKEVSSKSLEEIVIEKKEAGKIWLLFSDRRLGIRTVILYYNWLVASMVFYGISLNIGILYGDYYINVLLVVLVDFPGNALPFVMIDRFGRKKSHFIYMAACGVLLLSTILTVNFGGKDLQILTTVLALVGKMFSTAAFSTIFVLSAELFPTAIRNAGMGSSSCWARIGGMISPFIADTADLIGGTTGNAVPLVIFGGASIVAAVLTLILPETLGQVLPETVEDGKQFATKEYKEKSKQYMSECEKEVETTRF